jgi:hypothetical protein
MPPSSYQGKVNPDTKLLAVMGALGAAIGVGKLLSSGEPLTWRLAAGRAIVHGGLGLCAGAATLMFPAIGFAAQVGIACVLASLGTSALEVAFQKYMKK